MTDSNQNMSAHKGIEANIAGIAHAVNSKNLDIYGRLVTDDFLNMNRDLDGTVTSTVGRQSREIAVRLWR